MNLHLVNKGALTHHRQKTGSAVRAVMAAPTLPKGNILDKSRATPQGCYRRPRSCLEQNQGRSMVRSACSWMREKDPGRACDGSSRICVSLYLGPLGSWVQGRGERAAYPFLTRMVLIWKGLNRSCRHPSSCSSVCSSSSIRLVSMAADTGKSMDRVQQVALFSAS